MNAISLMQRAVATLLASVFLVQTVAAQLNTTLPDLGDPAQAELSPAKERRIGEEALREIRQDSSYLDDPEVESYLASLGNRLVAASKTENRDFVFVVLRDPSINAFALPGGVIGVHSGLILTAQSESELASVLAHEIGHIEQRHMVRMLSKQGTALAMVLASLLVAVLAGRSSGQAAEAAIVAGQAAAIQSTLSYSRDFEREADRVGLQILVSIPRPCPPSSSASCARPAWWKTMHPPICAPIP
jgi:predicted Zn-dependent protease